MKDRQTQKDKAATPEGTTAAACAAKASSQASAHIGKSLNSSSGGLTRFLSDD